MAVAKARDAGPLVTIMAAEVRCPDGMLAATVDVVDVGGGSQAVTVDGTVEDRVHPASRVFHVRLISPDRMLPDELRECDDYESACALGVEYARRLVEHRAAVDALAADLRV